MCGLVKRDKLEDVDLGFAFLPRFRSQGYALEAAHAVLGHARSAFALTRLVAIMTPANEPSQRLLEKLGFAYERSLDSAPGDPVRLYARRLS